MTQKKIKLFQSIKVKDLPKEFSLHMVSLKMTALQKQEMADLVQPARNEYSNLEELLWSSFFLLDWM